MGISIGVKSKIDDLAEERTDIYQKVAMVILRNYAGKGSSLRTDLPTLLQSFSDEEKLKIITEALIKSM